MTLSEPAETAFGARYWQPVDQPTSALTPCARLMMAQKGVWVQRLSWVGMNDATTDLPLGCSEVAPCSPYWSARNPEYR
jgi:hypothetical protein